MSPLGKFTFAVLGFYLFGVAGFLWGLILGHILIDNTIIIKKIESMVVRLDDNICLMLPYNLYNKIDGHFGGKIWGGILGLVLYGGYGFLFLFAAGHFLFDTPLSKHAKKARELCDKFFNDHIGVMIGGAMGFSLESNVLLFVGIVLGFFYDTRSFKNTLSLLGLSYLRIHKSDAYLLNVAALAAKISGADGKVSDEEKKLFDETFEISEKNRGLINKIFVHESLSPKGYEKYARRLRKITYKNLVMKEDVMEKLLKFSCIGGSIDDKKNEILEGVAKIIEMPEGNFRAYQKNFAPKCTQSNVADFYEVLGVLRSASDVEIKKRWHELLSENHPDKMQARGASAEEIEAGTQRIAQINNAYQMIMKTRKIA